MDLATLIGVIGAFAVVSAAIFLGGSPGVFFNVNSLIIVGVGTILVTMIKFSLAEFLGAAKIAVKAFSHKATSPEQLIELSVSLARAARQGGLLSLENEEINDEFMASGVRLLIDGHEQDVVRDMLTKDMRETVERHTSGRNIFKAIGDVGPAMGMIGTLIGLVQMLSAMDDPKQIGPAMAVALLTTLYGAMLANMFALPVADKLALRSKEERRSKSMVIDALIGIQDGQNPRVIEGLLQNYLPASKRSTDKEE